MRAGYRNNGRYGGMVRPPSARWYEREAEYYDRIAGDETLAQDVRERAAGQAQEMRRRAEEERSKRREDRKKRSTK